MKFLIRSLVIVHVLFSIKAFAQPVNGTSTFFTSTTTALAANTACSITKTVNVDGWLFSINTTSNCGFNWTNSTGGDGRIQYLVGFGTLTQAKMASDDGSEFQMQNLIWGVSTSSWTSKPMQFVGYKNGSAVSGATLNATTPSGTGILNTLVVYFNGNAAFNDVDEIRLAPNSTTCNSILFIEEITIGTATSTCVTPTLNLVAQNNVVCNSGATGSATVSASGGSPYTYTWSPTGGNAASATGLSAGTYTCAVTNSCASIDTQTITITQPSALSTSTGVTNPACNGGTGNASITASGGTSPYTYTWSTGATSSVVTGLLAGTYTVRVTDANNCSSGTKSVTLTQPSALATSTAVTNALCNGTNGSGTITASGGSGAYSYTWSSGPTTSVEPTLLAGTYTVKVTDANSCTSTKSVTITQPSALVTTTAASSASCNGSNGSATVTASGGTGAYSYTWSSGPTTSVEPTLLAGTYTVNVTDANSCSSTKSVTITQPSAIGTSTGYTNVFCNGGSSGSASMIASGGTSPYTYTWSTGSTNTFVSGVAAGSYTVRAIDANNCSSSTRTVIISQPSALVTSTAVTNVLCNGNNGSATLVASGGTGAYTYSWSSGATTSVVSLPSGAISATVTDANSCTSTAVFNITQPASLVSSTAVANALCNGGNGSATLTASGGTGAYTYSWSSGPTSSVAPALPAGTYTVRVTDANACSSTNSVLITQPTAIISSTGFTNVVCNGGSTGSASITASGGTSPLSYTWSSGTTNTLNTGIPAGTYTVVALDANNCSSPTQTIIITQPTALVSSTAVTNALCNGLNGSATVTATGGTGAYTYSWSSTASTSVTSLLSGVYTATVTDANACSSPATVNITQPAPLITSTAVTNVLCNGANGSATLTTSGGTGPYNYLWSTASTSSNTSVPAGAYTATVTDVNNCISQASVTLTQPSSLILSVTNTSVLCNGGSNASASVSASGGVPAYIYLWSNAATGSVVSSLPGGAYTGTVTDGNNCTATLSVLILQPAALATSTAVTNILCNGGNGSATVSTSGGIGAYTYSWSSAASASVLGSVTAGVYTITVTDANNCSSVKLVNITQPPALLSVTGVTNVLCNGGNGIANVTATGGSGAYSYLWSSTATTSVTSLPGGVYTCTVTDANACTSTASVTVTQPSAILISALTTSVLCNGGNGSATVSPSGGTGPYSYLWSSTATTSVVALAAGPFTATITDANNCTATLSIIMPQPTVLTKTLSVSNVLCNGGSSGSATVAASGGMPGYTYLWSNAATISVVSGFTAGVYTGTVTDINNCTTTLTATITQPSALVTSTAVTNVLCNGGNGSATVSTSGGTGAYTYSWSSVSTTSVLSGVLSGVYTTTVTDANSCSSIKSVNISQPSALATSTAVANVLCNGGNGTATITATGGTGPYTYLWSTSATTSVITSTSGVRTVTVTDANSCISTKTVTITQPLALANSTAVANVLCNGGNGSATVTASGGTGAYTYLWSSSATTSVATLPAGQHTVTVTDANACTASITVNLIQPTALVTSTAVLNVLCNGGTTGAATVTASGGTPGYTYIWLTSATSSVITGLNAGVKTVTVTDANACFVTNTVTVTQPAAIVATSTGVTNVLCFGGNNGSATVTASGGVPGYTYMWSTAATTSVIAGETAGIKTVTVTDANSCTSTNTVVVAQPAAPLTTSVTISNVLCFGGNTGSATVTTSGGTTAYQYLWSTAATTSIITTQTAGAKSVTVTDANGCTSSNSFTITEPSALATTTAVTNVLCKTDPSGSATVTASGGTTGYFYLWSTAATTSVISGETAGVKTVTVTDANACISTNTITITEPALSLTSSVATTSVSCFGDASGSGTVTANGGVGTYSFVWSTAATTSVITAQIAGIKTVTITDANACSTSNTLTILEPTAGLSAKQSHTNVTCVANGSAAVVASGGTSPYTYSWSATGGTAATSATLTASNYTCIITDLNNCTLANTISILSDTVKPKISLGADVSIDLGVSHQFSPMQTGAVSFTWSPPEYLSSISIIDPVATAPVGEYTYALAVTGTNGCVASDAVVLIVLETNLVIANYMSPNGDGANDTWKVNAPALIKDYSVEIVDGFGKTVFSVKDNYTNEFDGRFAGSELPDGVYYYFIKEGSSLKYKGSITLTK